MAVDTAGDLFIADTGNSGFAKSLQGLITTIAGNGVRSTTGLGGTATAAELYYPAGIALDAAGDLLISIGATQSVGGVDELSAATGNLIGVIGFGTGFGGDGGPAAQATVLSPFAVAVDTSGDLIVADTANNRVREVVAGARVTISQGTPVVSVADAGGSFSGAAFPAMTNVNGQASLEGVSPTLTYYSGTKVTSAPLSGAPSAPGTYTVLGYFSGSSDFGSATSSTTFTIARAVPNLVATDAGGVYNRVTYPATITVNGAASLEGINPTFAYYTGTQATGVPLTGPPSHAGTYTVAASFSGSTDFTAGNSATIFTIRPAPLTITADDKTKNYASALPALTVQYSGFVPGEDLSTLATLPSISTTASLGSHVAGGPYPITASGASDPDYAISYVDGSLTILPILLTITANNQTVDYGSPLPTLTAKYSGFVNSETAATLTSLPILATTATSTSLPSGNPYPITVSGAVDTDYSITYVNGAATMVVALHAPEVSSGTAPENGQSMSGLRMAPDANDLALVTNFQITNLAGGTLYLNDGVTPVHSGDFITLAQGNAGLKFSPTSNSTATGSFDVQAAVAASLAGLGGPNRRCNDQRDRLAARLASHKQRRSARRAQQQHLREPELVWHARHWWPYRVVQHLDVDKRWQLRRALHEHRRHFGHLHGDRRKYLCVLLASHRRDRKCRTAAHNARYDDCHYVHSVAKPQQSAGCTGPRRAHCAGRRACHHQLSEFAFWQYHLAGHGPAWFRVLRRTRQQPSRSRRRFGGDRFPESASHSAGHCAGRDRAGR